MILKVSTKAKVTGMRKVTVLNVKCNDDGDNDDGSDEDGDEDTNTRHLKLQNSSYKLQTAIFSAPDPSCRRRRRRGRRLRRRRREEEREKKRAENRTVEIEALCKCVAWYVPEGTTLWISVDARRQNDMQGRHSHHEQARSTTRNANTKHLKLPKSRNSNYKC